MPDRDLARLYGVETKYVKRQVKRNSDRFPTDFMVELTEPEFGEKMGLCYRPFVFAEQGIAQLSSVLNGPRAIAVNIQVIRLFA